MAVTTAETITLLENILYEDSALATANAAGWVNFATQASLTTPAALAGFMETQPEIGIAEEVARFYLGVLGRAPDAAGLAYWVKSVETGLTASQIATGVSAVPAATWTALANFFNSSSEFTGKYAGFGNNAFVTLLYENVLGRAPDLAGLGYWTAALAAGTTTSASLVQAFVNSTEYINDTSASFAAAAAANAVTIADGGTGAATIAIARTTPINQTFTLTTGTDTIASSAGDNAVIATDKTITASDSINFGTTSGNELIVTDSGSAPGGAHLSLLSVTGVQTLTLTSSTGLYGNAADVSGWSGLIAANFTLEKVTTNIGTLGVAGSGITVAATTEVTVDDTISTAANLVVSGGFVVVIDQANTVSDAGKTIEVLGGTGTINVSVTQTETKAGSDAAVIITDTNWAAGTKAGLVSAVVVDGLDTQGATINDNALSSLSVSDASAATITIAEGTYSAPATTLNLALNNDSGLSITDSNADYKTIAITTGASASTLTTFNDSAATSLTVTGSGLVTFTSLAGLDALKTIAISGAAGLTADASGLASLTAVTSTSTGVVSLALNGTQETFTGGAGQDVITLTQAATKAIAAGSAADNELVWNAPAATSFGSVSGFSVLGTSVLSTGVFDFTTLPSGFTAIDVQNTPAAGVTFTNVAVGTPLSIENTGAGGVIYQTTDTHGSADSAVVTIGAAGNTAIVTVASLTLEDKDSTGFGLITVVSNDTAAGGGNIISALPDSTLGTLTVDGSAGLTIGMFNDGVAALTINGDESGTGAITLIGVTGTSASALQTLTVTGADPVAVTLTETGAALTVNDSATAAVTVTPTDLAAATESFTNTGSSVLTIASHASAVLATLTLNGSVAYTATGDGVATGITVTGATDNAAVSITAAAGAGPGATDSFTLGNGADTIVDPGNGTIAVTIGNGADTVTLTGSGSQTVVAGTGTDSITTGTGAATVKVGTHTGADTFIAGASGSAVSYTTIAGAAAGDKIVIADGTAFVTTAVSATNVVNAGGNVLTLAGWLAGALSASGADLAAHKIAWFTFESDTVFVEQSATTGTAFGAGDTVVALVGTFSETSATFTASTHTLTLV
jgi:S-layer protein